MSTYLQIVWIITGEVLEKQKFDIFFRTDPCFTLQVYSRVIAYIIEM